MELIRLDLSDYRNGSKEQKDRFVNQLMKGFSTRGFIKLDNHGFDAAAVNDMFKWVKLVLRVTRL
jgi:isopenicillin N synthase-like dioxygenase